jgi:hypothetical protein
MVGVYILHYAVFFFCGWLGYEAGTRFYEKKRNQAISWVVGLIVWIISMVPFAFFLPPLPK